MKMAVRLMTAARGGALADALGAAGGRRAPSAGDDGDDGAECDGFGHHDADIARLEVLGGAVEDDVRRDAVASSARRMDAPRIGRRR